MRVTSQLGDIRRVLVIGTAAMLVLTGGPISAQPNSENCDRGENTYGESECSGVNDPPDVGTIILCENTFGEKVPFEVIDAAGGANFEVWVLNEVDDTGSNDMRVGFNNQVVQTKKATSVIVEVFGGNNLPDDHVKYEDSSSTIHTTGQCGWGPYGTFAHVNDPATVEVTASFSGMDITVTEAQGESVTHSEWDEDTETWGFSATAEDDGGEVTGSYEDSHTYGESTTTTWAASSSVTWSSSFHGFFQDYALP